MMLKFCDFIPGKDENDGRRGSHGREKSGNA